jgi:hypothetical protein
VKLAFVSISDPSGMVTSEIKTAWLHGREVSVGEGVFVGGTTGGSGVRVAPAGGGTVLVRVETGVDKPAITVWATSVALIGAGGVKVGVVCAAIKGRLHERDTSTSSTTGSNQVFFIFANIFPSRTNKCSQLEIYRSMFFIYNESGRLRQ